uniref:Uncharacterized protein n=1 Tax=Nelumbo nucifera TaxID=4432 RepID=A0A822ZV48_NELNU|nr:TPA_asm: hypothetical protein HUJ06_003998 [Nelumbo nucifera]
MPWGNVGAYRGSVCFVRMRLTTANCLSRSNEAPVLRRTDIRADVGAVGKEVTILPIPLLQLYAVTTLFSSEKKADRGSPVREKMVKEEEKKKEKESKREKGS